VHSRFSTVPLFPQPHPSPAAVLGNELDASGFKRSLDCSDVIGSRRSSAALETVDSRNANSSRVSQLLSIQIDGGAGHPALSWRDHVIKLQSQDY
jgi:hypothetical protein